MNRVLITGITGKNGRYLLEQMELNKDKLKGVHFKVFLREGSDTTYLDKSTIDIERFIGDIDSYEGALKFTEGGYDTILHIAGIQRSVQVVKAAINHGRS